MLMGKERRKHTSLGRRQAEGEALGGETVGAGDVCRETTGGRARSGARVRVQCKPLAA
jgi:hypothetical protein